IWPEGDSGVTIGVGYDLGYNTRATIGNDWIAHLGPDMTSRLQSCASAKGQAARALLPSVHDLVIPWPPALAVFRDVTIPRYWRSTRDVFPGVERLDPNCQGALLSLVFNRGTKLDGDRRREMREIRRLVLLEEYAGIAAQLRAMKRLWIGTPIEG